jgi:hypothetical protein
VFALVAWQCPWLRQACTDTERCRQHVLMAWTGTADACQRTPKTESSSTNIAIIADIRFHTAKHNDLQMQQLRVVKGVSVPVIDLQLRGLEDLSSARGKWRQCVLDS